MKVGNGHTNYSSFCEKLKFLIPSLGTVLLCLNEFKNSWFYNNWGLCHFFAFPLHAILDPCLSIFSFWELFVKDT